MEYICRNPINFARKIFQKKIEYKNIFFLSNIINLIKPFFVKSLIYLIYADRVRLGL